MAFDFDNLTENNNNLDPSNWEIIYSIYFEDCCDSLSKNNCTNNKQQTQYLIDKGFFIADKFYMVNPYSYLGIEQHPCHNYFSNGSLFLYLGVTENSTDADSRYTKSEAENRA